MAELIQKKIPAKTLTWLKLTGAVLDIAQNTCVFVGDISECRKFDFDNDKYVTIPL